MAKIFNQRAVYIALFLYQRKLNLIMKYLKIGIIGGTYNPVHNAHLEIAGLFREQMQLGRCFFVPANISPFKTEDLSAIEIPSEHRVAMLELALADFPDFEIEMFEILKKGISHTYDTILYFKNKFPNAELHLLIGDDQAALFTNWGNWEKILKSASLCIANRNKEMDISTKNQILNTLTIDGKIPFWLDTPIIDISSSMIRALVNERKQISGLVPQKVSDYIYKHKLYLNT